MFPFTLQDRVILRIAETFEGDHRVQHGGEDGREQCEVGEGRRVERKGTLDGEADVEVLRVAALDANDVVDPGRARALPGPARADAATLVLGQRAVRGGSDTGFGLGTSDQK